MIILSLEGAIYWNYNITNIFIFVNYHKNQPKQKGSVLLPF
jgi:hypothetical protein